MLGSHAVPTPISRCGLIRVLSESELISLPWHMPPLASGGLLRAAQRIPLGRGVSDMGWLLEGSQVSVRKPTGELEPAAQHQEQESEGKL